VPVSGPFVQIDHPDGDTLSPTVTDYDWSPNVNERPSVEITVPESDRWDELTGQPMRVWIDGTQLPIDTLAGTRTTTGDRGSQTVLEGSGGTQLDDYIDDIQFGERENHLAAEDLITERTLTTPRTSTTRHGHALGRAPARRQVRRSKTTYSTRWKPPTRSRSSRSTASHDSNRLVLRGRKR